MFASTSDSLQDVKGLCYTWYATTPDTLHHCSDSLLHITMVSIVNISYNVAVKFLSVQHCSLDN